MKVNREYLESYLGDAILSISTNKDMLKKVKNNMHKGSLSKIVDDVLKGNLPLETLDEQTLCVVNNLIYEVTERSLLKPSKYFTDVELELAADKEKEESLAENLKFPIVFENVTKLNDDYYAFFLKATDLVKLYHNNMITYNFDTQRAKKSKKLTNGEVAFTIDINKRSVEEMKELMIKNNFFTNFITLNLLEDRTEEFKYDEVNHTLTIFKGNINIVDGMHRSLAMLKATAEDSELKYITGVNFVNFDKNKAKQYIIQENKQNKISKDRIQNMDDDNKSNKIIDMLNSKTNSELKDKIVTDFKDIKGGYVLWGTLRQSIDQLFNLKTQNDIYEVFDFLLEGYNYIIGYYKDYFFENIEKSRKEGLYAHNNAFILYTSILKELFNKDKYELNRTALRKILNKFDFSMDGDLADMELDRGYNKTTKKIFNNIIKKGKEVVRDE